MLFILRAHLDPAGAGPRQNNSFSVARKNMFINRPDIPSLLYHLKKPKEYKLKFMLNNECQYFIL